MQMFFLDHRKPFNHKQDIVETLSQNSGHLKKSENRGTIPGTSYILWAYPLLLLHFYVRMVTEKCESEA